MIKFETGVTRNSSCSSQDCLSSAENPSEGNKADSVARELLTYLGHLPYRLHKNELEAAEMALQLGNALIWIHHWLESKPEIETPIGETPQSLYALGKQFQVVARSQMGKTQSKDQYTGVLKLILDQGKQLDVIEKTLSVLVNHKGGGK